MKLVIVTECEVPGEEIPILMGFLVENFKSRIENITSMHAAINETADAIMDIVAPVDTDANESETPNANE